MRKIGITAEISAGISLVCTSVYDSFDAAPELLILQVGRKRQIAAQ